MKSSRGKWAYLSGTSLVGFVCLVSFILVALKFDYFSWLSAIIFGSFITPTGLFFLSMSGYDKKLFKRWKSLPKIMHQLITIMCTFWIGFFVIKVLPIALKKEYEKE